MITLSNKHRVEYVIASGALGFDGEGWFWEKPLTKLGLIDRSPFYTVLRTLTVQPRPYPISNLSWIRPWTWVPSSPWSCVRLLRNDGVVNKVGFYNPGFDYWYTNTLPKLDYGKGPLVPSIAGNSDELAMMVAKLNLHPFPAIEYNPSCVNTGITPEEEVIESGRRLKRITDIPLWVKVSAAHNVERIADGLKGYVEAIAINSVPWQMVFTNDVPHPLRCIGGQGGVSGKPAQQRNWAIVERLVRNGSIPVIGPSVMSLEDVKEVRKRGAQAVSFGVIHLPTKGKPWTLFTNPLKPTQIVKFDQAEQQPLF